MLSDGFWYALDGLLNGQSVIGGRWTTYSGALFRVIMKMLPLRVRVRCLHSGAVGGDIAVLLLSTAEGRSGLAEAMPDSCQY